jgi:hypothetical protein
MSSKNNGGEKGIRMRNKKIYLIVTLFLVINLLSACSKPKEPTPTPDLSDLLIISNWINEPLRVTESDLTLEVIHVSQKGDDLTVRVRFPLQDWRNWYVSKVGLSVEGGEVYYNTASTRFYERLYQKDLNSYCLYQPEYNEIERCLETKPDATYQIDEIIFKDVPSDLSGKRLEFEVIELSTQIFETSDCEQYRMPYMQSVLNETYPGLALECSAGQPVISEASGFASDEAAQAALQALIKEAGSGSMQGPWTFEFSKP